MNKFDFILENKTQKLESKELKAEEEIFFEFHRDFKFSFRTELFSNRIVKSEITENVLEQIKQMFEIIKESNQELSYLKMNSNTKLKFRMYWSYEIDRVLKDKIQFDNVSGNLMGIPIILNDDIQTDIVQPIIVKNKKNNKFLNIIKK